MEQKKKANAFYLDEEERIKLIKIMQHFKGELIYLPPRIIEEIQLLKTKLKIYTYSMELLEHYKPLEDVSITNEDIIDINDKLEEIEREISKSSELLDEIEEFNERLKNR